MATSKAYAACSAVLSNAEGSRSSLPSTSSVFLNRAFFNRMKRHQWAPTASAPPHHHLKSPSIQQIWGEKAGGLFYKWPRKKKKRKMLFAHFLLRNIMLMLFSPGEHGSIIHLSRKLRAKANPQLYHQFISHAKRVRQHWGSTDAAAFALDTKTSLLSVLPSLERKKDQTAI